ncbi:hypothetical protein [Variovorax sp. DXTD-1]|uniref:hypothetical protein n=1 Tax=Variovorax sp. DXTD-1 TaxID=2495592 RepID=UPI000F864F0D|nr:hypothetical protein [Variovorax sp. DXTD-1]RST53545.1 hypothetical protein EJI00_04650 [Variovorax sp. DXTD-1]
MPRPALPALVLAVVTIHAAVLWLLLVASQPHERPAGSIKRIAMEVVQVVTPAKPAPSEQREQPTVKPRTAPMAAAPRPVPRRASRPAPSGSIPATPDTLAEPAQATGPPATPPLTLDTEATRRALRDVARQRSFADQANQSINGRARSALDTPLSAGVANAARGDCMRGQFKGSDMGLLSLPMLALAAARNECGR